MASRSINPPKQTSQVAIECCVNTCRNLPSLSQHSPERSAFSSDSIQRFTALHRRPKEKNSSAVNDVPYVNKTRAVSPLSSRHNPPRRSSHPQPLLPHFVPDPPFISTLAALINQKCVVFFSLPEINLMQCGFHLADTLFPPRNVSDRQRSFAPASDIPRTKSVQKSLRTHWEFRRVVGK